MYRISQKTAGNASRIMAAMAAGLLLMYVVEAMDKLPAKTLIVMEEETKGAVFGVSSAVLFVAAFALELRERGAR
jgi:hypothetical protein